MVKNNNNKTLTIELDLMYRSNSKKILLIIIFVQTEFMIALLLDSKNLHQVRTCFNHLHHSSEKNLKLIYYFIPKECSLDELHQKDINLMTDHINSYHRNSLGNKCPYDMFSSLYGEEILSILGCKKIASELVTLNYSIFKRGTEIDN